MIDTKIIRHLSNDQVLRDLIDNLPPPDYPESGGLYQDLLRSIVGQQLSGKAAATIYGRFIDLFDEGIPHAEQLLELAPETLRSAGLSRQKASYLQNVARFFQTENIEHSDLHDMSDEEVIRYLTQIKGVGRWTVEMILMFTLRRPDILPLDDLGIQNAIIACYQLEAKGKELKQQMMEVAEPWRPYRSYACRYLWRSLD